MIEDLNKSGGYKHILLVRDQLSGTLLSFPLKTKETSEVSKILVYSVFQLFNTKYLHTDNGPLFRSVAFNQFLASVRIQKLNSVSESPQAYGDIERSVGVIKNMLKKTLSTNNKDDYNWEFLPYVCKRMYNTSISPKHNLKPLTLVFGETGNSESFLDREEVTTFIIPYAIQKKKWLN